MTGLPKLFFVTGAVFALLGMVWGIQMSATHDHTLSPAHGHLNLIGFVAMTLFGVFYALVPAAAVSRLARAHYGLTVLAVVILIPGIALAISRDMAVLAQIGSLLTVGSMALYLWIVLRHAR